MALNTLVNYELNIPIATPQNRTCFATQYLYLFPKMEKSNTNFAILLRDLRHSIIVFELSTDESNTFTAAWLSDNRFIFLVLGFINSMWITSPCMEATSA